MSPVIISHFDTSRLPIKVDFDSTDLLHSFNTKYTLW